MATTPRGNSSAKSASVDRLKCTIDWDQVYRLTGQKKYERTPPPNSICFHDIVEKTKCSKTSAWNMLKKLLAKGCQKTLVLLPGKSASVLYVTLPKK